MGCCSSARANKFQTSEDINTHLASKNLEKSEELVIEPGNFVLHKLSMISDEYVFGPELGSGAFGCVRRAVHKQTGQERAVKTIKKSSVTIDHKQKTKFISEVEILRSTDHPNIVKLFEFYEDEKYFHLVTEIVKGGDFFDFIVNCKVLTEPIAAFFFKQILSAVFYCHSRGIVHRDLKPENLLLEKKSPSSILKVIDFGTSTLFNHNTKLRGKFGTAYYIAPEVLSHNYNEKCDIWSCGVILFILLSGKPPFNGATDSEIVARVKTGRYSFKSKEWDNISTEAKIFITRMLELDTAKRISAQEALHDVWIEKYSQRSQGSHLPVSILSNMKSFHSQSKLHQAVLTFISSQLANREEIQNLSEIFQAIDLDGDGKLSKEELLKEYLKTKSITQAQEEVEKVMREVDVNNSGFIDYSEFLMASLKKDTLLSKSNLESAFKVFDQDSSGSINSNDLKKLLGNENVTDEVWKELIQKVDSNSDGTIDLKEFTEMMLSLF